MGASYKNQFCLFVFVLILNLTSVGQAKQEPANDEPVIVELGAGAGPSFLLGSLSSKQNFSTTGYGATGLCIEIFGNIYIPKWKIGFCASWGVLGNNPYYNNSFISQLEANGQATTYTYNMTAYNYGDQHFVAGLFKTWRFNQFFLNAKAMMGGTSTDTVNQVYDSQQRSGTKSYSTVTWQMLQKSTTAYQAEINIGYKIGIVSFEISCSYLHYTLLFEGIEWYQDVTGIKSTYNIYIKTPVSMIIPGLHIVVGN